MAAMPRPAHAAANSSSPADELNPFYKMARVITGPLIFLFILGDVLDAGVYAVVRKIASIVGGRDVGVVAGTVLLARCCQQIPLLSS